ncbi:ParB family protein [Azotobacter beijerinckii]|uniref:ParB family protein n=1 Tax=Azotobacter beijerinckii TaxID=170623 RepID=A0A1H6Z642_9GAMM|nr:ParB/RepB/Spo0J family partition protein [Azotobacter beijerinckii]SEJ45010.1 ParB family protein [Azotobacter beijerinckii]SEJ55532.1 ParB family protein [Azotobacter beijerinckii]SER72567.1 ParB family protein [Azotobacter beijerinckii]
MKSDDYPGRKRTAGMMGLRVPAAVPQHTEQVSRAQMLAMSKEEDSPAESAVENEATANSQTTLAEIPVEAIKPSPYQPRLTINEAAIEELANSIQSIGLVKPLIVRPVGLGDYELIGGERRWRAHKLVGIKTVMAYVRSMDDAMAKILALTDNEGQEPLTEYERGRSYAHILESGDEPSQRALARRLGVNVSIISRCLLLMELPEAARQILDKNPGLVGGLKAKEFIEFGKTHPDLLVQAITSMRDEGISQVQALRWIGQKIAEQKGNPEGLRVTSKAIRGLGTMKVDGRKMEFRCEKNVDMKLLSEQIAAFLETINLDSLKVN